jgi:hypothetical protein
MDFSDAAKQLVDETCHKAQLGMLGVEDRAEVERETAAALAASVGKSDTSLAEIVRGLYWKLNPLGSVPFSFYEDANFDRLADRIKAITDTGAPFAPDSEIQSRALSGDSEIRLNDIDEDPSANGGELIGRIDAAAPETGHPATIVSPSLEEFLALHAYEAAPESPALGGIQKILIEFVADLADVFTIKPEWHGREAEAVAAPARIAARKIIDVWSRSPARRPSDEEICEIVPKDWAAEVARTLFDLLDNDVVAMWWSVDGVRDAAIETVAAKIGTRIGRIASIDACIVRNGFDEPVTIENPDEWAHEVAGDVYRMLLADDFQPYAASIGAASREKSITYLGKSIFENIVPAVAFKAMRTPEPSAPAVNPTSEIPEVVRREPWKMPWSVARRVVDELCLRSGDEKALLAPFGEWLGLPADDIEGIKNELVSEVVIIGREQPVREESTTTSGPAVRFIYENHAGRVAVRSVVPVRMTFGSNEFHTERQWLLEAFCTDHGAMRTFACKGIIKFI